MSDMELASYLSMLGHNVHREKGMNIDVLFNEGLDNRPIDYEKFEAAATEEGYSFTKRGWSIPIKQKVIV